jgi:hypothetical protein
MRIMSRMARQTSTAAASGRRAERSHASAGVESAARPADDEGMHLARMFETHEPEVDPPRGPDPAGDPDPTGDASRSLAAIGAALPDFVLGALFLATWVLPTAARIKFAPQLVLIALLEFVIIHSSAFAGNIMLGKGPRGARAASLIALGLFYTLFVGAFGLMFKTWWPLVSFWGLMLNRLLSLFLGQAPEGEEKALIQRGWAATAIFYLGSVMLTAVLPVPRLGMTSTVVASLHIPGSGMWVSQPWRVMAFGFLYFTAVGISELTHHRWLRGSVPQS